MKYTILLIAIAIVIFSIPIHFSEPGFNGTNPGCNGSGCHTLEDGLVSASVIDLQVAITLSLDVNNKLTDANRPVLGGCVAHNCRLGSGLVIFPARTIESDVVLFASNERRVIDRDLLYEQSDHHQLAFSHLHPRLYPRPGESGTDTW